MDVAVTANVTPPSTRRPAAPFTVRAAQRAAATAAPWHIARKWAGRPAPKVARHVDGRPLTPTAAGILALVRQAPVCREKWSGLNVTLDALAWRFARPGAGGDRPDPRTLAAARRKVCRALEELGDHRVPCVGPCKRPGIEQRADGTERPLCRGCADPCLPTCARHARLVRRVHQFTQERWTDPATGRTWARRQRASVLVLDVRARSEKPRPGACPQAPRKVDNDVTPNHPLPSSKAGRGRENKRGGVGCADVVEARSLPTWAPPPPIQPVAESRNKRRLAATYGAPEGVELDPEVIALRERLLASLATPQPPPQVMTRTKLEPRSDAPEATALVKALPVAAMTRHLPASDKAARRAALAHAREHWARTAPLEPCAPETAAALREVDEPGATALEQWAALLGGRS